MVIPHEGKAGDTLTTRIRYHGEANDGLIIGRNSYGDHTVFADNWPDRAHHWFPTPDIPGDKATVATAFKKAAHVARLSLVNNRLIGNPMEPGLRVPSSGFLVTTGLASLKP